MSKIFSILVLTLFALQTFANPTKDKVVGSILKNALESYHYKKMRINNSVSKKAFKEYLKKVDFGKQFLLSSDVSKLKKYELEMDDQMINGEHALVEQTKSIMEKSIKAVDAYRKKFLKKALILQKKKVFSLIQRKENGSNQKKKARDLEKAI